MRKARTELDMTMSYTNWWTRYNHSEDAKKSEEPRKPVYNKWKKFLKETNLH